MPDSDLKEVVRGGFRRTAIRYPPNYRMEMHSDDVSHISVVVAGAVREWTSRADVIGETTAVVVKPADVPHADLFGPHGACLVSVDWPAELDDASLNERLLWHDHGALAAAAIALIDPAAWTTGQSVENRFFEFLSCFDEVGDRRGTPPSWLLRVKEHLDDTFSKSYSVRHLAEEAGVHPVHLARTFRRCFGCTVQEYVRLRRVRAMADRLIYTRRSAWHLALETGFADGAHATRSFRKELGTTPSRYRRIF